MSTTQLSFWDRSWNLWMTLNLSLNEFHWTCQHDFWLCESPYCRGEYVLGWWTQNLVAWLQRKHKSYSILLHVGLHSTKALRCNIDSDLMRSAQTESSWKTTGRGNWCASCWHCRSPFWKDSWEQIGPLFSDKWSNKLLQVTVMHVRAA